jgi:hypothetical protein
MAHVVQVAPDDAHVCMEEGVFPAAELTVERALHLHGAGPGTVLDAGERWIFRATGATDFTLEDVSVEGLAVSAVGGVLQARGEADVVLRNIDVNGVTTASDDAAGGLVYADQGTALTIEAGRMSDVAMTADNVYGLAIYLYTGSLEQRDLHVQCGAVNADYVGTVYAANPTTLTLTDVEVSGLDLAPNYTLYAMGLYMAGEPYVATIDGLTLRDNTAQFVYPAHLQAIGAMGLYMDHYGDSAVEIHRLLVQDNHVEAPGPIRMMGGVIYSGYGDHVVTNALIADNTVQSQGGNLQGGVAMLGNGAVTWQNTDVADNAIRGFDTVQGATFMNISGGSFQAWNTSLVRNDFGAATVAAMGWYSWDGDGSSRWLFSNVHGNLPQAPLSYIGGTTSDPDVLDADPDYADAARNLGPESPLIDAGDPSVLDADGSPSDIGAHGGPKGDQL